MRPGNCLAFWRWLIALMLITLASAHAQTCSFSVSSVNFGAVDTLSGANDDTTATTSISCTGTSFSTIRLCPNLGFGTGGVTESNRRMLNGANALNYQLYATTWGGTIWGSNLLADSPTPPALSVALNGLGSGSISPTIYARAFGGQSTAPGGSYISTYSGTQAQLRYQYCVGTCPACSASLTRSVNATFTVNATIANNCLIAAQNLNFGAIGVLNTNVDAR
jgi:spore coat protein U-like protein